MEVEEKKTKKISSIIANILYFLIITVLILIDVSLIYQQIVYKDKIPNILGYKMFMIGKDYMDESLCDGDLVFTRNIDSDNVNVGDIIAFRNANNLVTIHKVLEISDSKYTTRALQNEIESNKHVEFERLEGILVYKIPIVGKVILFIINPIVLTAILLTILIIGFILYKIAQKHEKSADN